MLVGRNLSKSLETTEQRCVHEIRQSLTSDLASAPDGRAFPATTWLQWAKDPRQTLDVHIIPEPNIAMRAPTVPRLPVQTAQDGPYANPWPSFPLRDVGSSETRRCGFQPSLFVR